MLKKNIIALAAIAAAYGLGGLGVSQAAPIHDRRK